MKEQLEALLKELQEKYDELFPFFEQYCFGKSQDTAMMLVYGKEMDALKYSIDRIKKILK